MDISENQWWIIYEWIDSIPWSREKKNISRDFCDGVLIAEIIKHYHPKFVELHNYPSTWATKQKLANWNTLCIKVLKKLKLTWTQTEINDIINSKPKCIERLWFKLHSILVKKEWGDIKRIDCGSILDSLDRFDNKDIHKLKNEIENYDTEIAKMTEYKNTLETQLKKEEQEKVFLQRQIAEAKTRLEYMPKLMNI